MELTSNTNSHLVDQFFADLKKYNITNFKTIEKYDIQDDPIIYKSFSSVITRFFIFAEHHEELSLSDVRMIYYQLKIDLIANYFSTYPNTDFTGLESFQNELRAYVNRTKKGDSYGDKPNSNDAA